MPLIWESNAYAVGVFLNFLTEFLALFMQPFYTTL